MKSKNPVNIGDVFGRLTVIGKTKVAKKTKNTKTGLTYQAYSVCRCECGKQTIVSNYNLFNGRCKSCGCLHSEIVSLLMTKLLQKHNMWGTGIYRSWAHMKQRCDNKKNAKYKDYGARGITYELKWTTFEGFFEDMGPTYQEGLSIERIDTNGNYCKENCRWATLSEQSQNKRNVMEYFYNNEWLKSWEIENKFNLTRTQFRRLNLPKRKLYEE